PSNTLRAYLCRFTVRAPVISLEDFLDSVKSEASVLNFPPHHSLRLLNGFAYSTLLLLGRTRPAVRSSYPPASPHRSNDNEVVQKYQSVIHRLRLRPQLRSRLTLSGRAFLRNPWAFGERDSHSFFVTHTGILTSTRSISPHDLTSLRAERSPTAVP